MGSTCRGVCIRVKDNPVLGEPPYYERCFCSRCQVWMLKVSLKNERCICCGFRPRMKHHGQGLKNMVENPKCANAVCIKESSGGEGIKGRFCYSCLASPTRPVFSCDECGEMFMIILRGRIPRWCSDRCRQRYMYRKKHEVKPNPEYIYSKY